MLAQSQLLRSNLGLMLQVRRHAMPEAFIDAHMIEWPTQETDVTQRAYLSQRSR